MDSPKFYNNPAFCQQSEFYSHHHQTRQSPIGARKLSFTHHSENPQISGEVEEQEFYEEVIVDNNGFIKGKKFVVVAQNHEGQKYIQVPQRRTPQKERYEYIPMREKERKISQSEEIVEIAPGIMHRYAVIDPSSDNDPELSPNREKYALVPVSDLKRIVSPQNQRKLPQNSPPNWIELPHTPIKSCTPLNSRSTTPNYSSSKFRSGTNPLATQKLHELLSTPKNTHHHQTPPNISISPIRSGNFATLGRNHGFSAPSKVQQKLTTRYEAEQNRVEALEREKFKMQQHFARTAIVQPNSFIDSRKNYPSDGQKSLDTSWISQNGKLPFESGKALAAAAFITFLCGIGTTGLCFYMLSFMGRPYYLDFSTVAGFTCSLLGILGCRSRNVYWIPNRNYLSGYLVLSLFSLSTCVGLIILLINKPMPGTPLADMTSAAICGFSVLILLLSLTGVVSSYCCKYPPPDNRVQHCSPGLTV